MHFLAWRALNGFIFLLWEKNLFPFNWKSPHLYEIIQKQNFLSSQEHFKSSSATKHSKTSMPSRNFFSVMRKKRTESSVAKITISKNYSRVSANSAPAS